MAKAEVLRTDYTEAPDDELDTKATAVKEGLEGHPGPFPAPPVLPPALAALILTFMIAHTAYKRGGLDQKPAFEAAKQALLDALNDNADYVDGIADGSTELIINAGYVPTKTTSTARPVPGKPVVSAERGEASGEILVECAADKNADFYGLIASEGAPLANSNFLFQNGLISLDPTNQRVGVDINKSRKKRLQDLTPGTTYYFYMYAGNANGISALSNVVSLMAAS